MNIFKKLNLSVEGNHHRLVKLLTNANVINKNIEKLKRDMFKQKNYHLKNKILLYSKNNNKQKKITFRMKFDKLTFKLIIIKSKYHTLLKTKCRDCRCWHMFIVAQL